MDVGNRFVLAQFQWFVWKIVRGLVGEKRLCRNRSLPRRDKRESRRDEADWLEIPGPKSKKAKVFASARLARLRERKTGIRRERSPGYASHRYQVGKPPVQ